MRLVVYAVLGAVAAAILLVVSQLNGEDHPSAKEPSSVEVTHTVVKESAKPTPKAIVKPSPEARGGKAVKAKPDPSNLKADKIAIRVVLGHFVSAFYSRDEQLLSGSPYVQQARYESRLAPYVTDYFLNNYTPPLTTPQDEAVKNRGGSVTAQVVSLDGGQLDGKVAEGLVTIRLLAVYPHTPIHRQLLDLTVGLTDVDNVWKVDSVQLSPS